MERRRSRAEADMSQLLAPRGTRERDGGGGRGVCCFHCRGRRGGVKRPRAADGGEMEVRWRRDGGEMEERWRGDGGEMEERWRRDGGEMEGSVAS